MTLSDTTAYRNVIGCLMKKPLLLLEYDDIKTSDFDIPVIIVCFNTIQKLYQEGATVLSILDIDQEIARYGGAAEQVYKNSNGLEFLKQAYQTSEESSFELYYKRMKKCSLLRRLQKAHYDISKFYIDSKDVTDPRIEAQIIKRFDEASLEEILNEIEKDYSDIRNDVLNGGRKHGDPAEGLIPLIERLKTQPSIGAPLEGELFNAICRGARQGCFFLKSASTSGGKSRTSVFDACRIAYPKRWSYTENKFIEEVEKGEVRKPRKVLFIVTEMDKEELQTIMLAYLSGINEDKIITGNYETPMEEARVKQAAHIIEEYSGYFIIEEISEPNLQNIESTIRKYATVDEVKYVFFDYIHTTASLVEQFTRNNLREDVVLMLLANQLKQLAKDYNLFIFSATQVNAFGMSDEEMEFKDERSIRGSKAVADKCDMGYVMTRIPEKFWESIQKSLHEAIRDGRIEDASIFDTNKPTHVLDIYKMRRGRYKMVRVWTKLDLGTGERKDIFVTDAINNPIKFTSLINYGLEEREITT